MAIRSGVKRIEVLVATLVVAVLVAIGVPWIAQFRDEARRIQCQENIRNLALAASNFEGKLGHYPGYYNCVKTANDGTLSAPGRGPLGFSWVLSLVTELEKSDGRWHAWTQPSQAQTDVAALDVLKKNLASLDVLQCPADRVSEPRRTPLSYAANSGCIDVAGTRPDEANPADEGIPQDWGANGIFFDHFTNHPNVNKSPRRVPMVKMNNMVVRDGIGQTIMFSENLNARDCALLPSSAAQAESAWGTIWDIDGAVDPQGPFCLEPPWLQAPDPRAKPMVPPKMKLTAPLKGLNEDVAGGLQAAANNTQLTGHAAYAWSRPSSHHRGGMFVAYCDGRTYFLPDQTPYYVYCLLCSSNGATVRKPGHAEPLDPNPFSGPKLRPGWVK